MKQIKQATLVQRSGTGDKLYEVELCEVGPNQYVVNFRQGPRNGPFREGSKTVVPVPQNEADRIYDRLVDGRLNKGFVHESQLSQAPAAPAAPAPSATASAKPKAPKAAPKTKSPQDHQAQIAATINRLKAGDNLQGYREWKLDRAIWKTGELAISDAEPELLKLLDQANITDLRKYCLVFALGRCGSDQALAKIKTIYEAPGTVPYVRRMAAESLRALYSDQDRQAFAESARQSLPKSLQDLAKDGPAELFNQELKKQLGAKKGEAFEAIDRLYLIDNEHVRPALLELARTAPFDHHYFPRLRGLLKSAEFRRDGELYGIIAHRIEKTPPATQSKKGSLTPFTPATKKYLRRRLWRSLRRLGAEGQLEYVKMAVGVLLPFTDQDKVPERQKSYYTSGGSTRVYWDGWAPYHAFNAILHTNSKRYGPDRDSNFWRAGQKSPKPNSDPTVIEEAYPELWDQLPQGLLHLLDGSRNELVHHFAVRALKRNSAFLDKLDLEPIIMLINGPYGVTSTFGFELARKRYDPNSPNTQLIRALLNCRSTAARSQAQRWIDEQRSFFLEDDALLVDLIGSSHADNRTFAKQFLKAAFIPFDKAEKVVAGTVKLVLSLPENERPRAKDIAETLIRCFIDQLRQLDESQVEDLLAHPILEVQELGGEVLLGQAKNGQDVPDPLLVALLDSKHSSIRSIGVRMLANIADDKLVQRKSLLISLCKNKQADLRKQIRPAVKRIAMYYPEVAEEITQNLLLALCRRAPDGVHAHLLDLLKTELQPFLKKTDPKVVWRLLNSKASVAQEMGGVLLAEVLKPDDLSVWQLVKLANHDVRSVRTSAQKMAESSVPRLKRSMASTIRFLETKWDDSRNWAFDFIKKDFEKQDLPPVVLVAICDSVRQDVQSFGQKLITQYFEDKDGPDYLLKLSEHPSTNLQLFATNYLERFATDNLERINGLTHYFLAVLSQVNRGRVAKTRALMFLEQEALKSEAAAKQIAKLLARQSATIAIQDKARTIEAMLRIHQAYPTVELPIKIKPVEVRSGV